jgi:hypothetical protein
VNVNTTQKLQFGVMVTEKSFWDKKLPLFVESPYRQTKIKWSFFVEHLNSWIAGSHENHENWYTTNKNEFTVLYIRSL